MKTLSLMLAVLMIAAAGWAMPMVTSLAEKDTTFQLVWVNSGAGVETPAGMLNDSVVIFEPVLMVEPIGLRWHAPSTPVKYFGISTLITANSTGVMPHLGAALHAGPYMAAGMTWGSEDHYFYLSSEELVKTIFNWIGKGAGVIAKKL